MRVVNIFRLKVIILLLMCSLLPQLLKAQLKNPEKFFNEVKEKYNKVDNLVIDFIQEIKTPVFQEKQTVKAKLYYVKENKYRLELQNQTIVCDGKTVYNYTRPAKKVIISNFEENFFSPSNLLVNVVSHFQIEFLGEEKVNNKSLYKFSLHPQRKNPEFKTMTLWIDLDKTIQKLETEDWAGNTYTFQLLSISINQQLKSELFSLNIPSGVKVVDLR